MTSTDTDVVLTLTQTVATPTQTVLTSAQTVLTSAQIVLTPTQVVVRNSEAVVTNGEAVLSNGKAAVKCVSAMSYRQPHKNRVANDFFSLQRLKQPHPYTTPVQSSADSSRFI